MGLVKSRLGYMYILANRQWGRRMHTSSMFRGAAHLAADVGVVPIYNVLTERAKASAAKGHHRDDAHRGGSNALAI